VRNETALLKRDEGKKGGVMKDQRQQKGGVMKNQRMLLSVVCTTLVLMFALLWSVFAQSLCAQVIPLSKTYNWKMVTEFPSGHSQNVALKQFIDTIKERTDGKVRISLYEGTLGAPKDYWEMVKGNAVQFAYLTDSAHASRMPIIDLLQLPFEIKDLEDITNVTNEWAKAGYMKEVTDAFKLLGFTSVSPNTIFTKNKKLSTMADLKGLKIRVNTKLVGQVVSTLGGTGVSMPAGEVYMSLQTGVIDGAVTGIVAFTDRRFYEVCKYALQATLLVGSVATVMNKETWEGLPKELQNLITEVMNKEIAGHIKRGKAEENDKWEVARKAGVTVYAISAEEQARWRKALESVDDDYVRELTAKGYPAKQAQDLMRKVVNKK
jgi:TRAP-type C4-dicarboxylate transport system substrate-binding protein